MGRRSSNNYLEREDLERELLLYSKSYKEELSVNLKIVRKEYKKEHNIKKLTEKQQAEILKLANKRTKGVVSEELGAMFIKVAEKLASAANFAGYTWKDEMIGLGIYFLCSYAHNYDPTKKNCNPFAYVTTICKNGFLQTLEREQGHSDLKDKLIKKAMKQSELDKWLGEDSDYE